jgi:hypothetical protein
VSTASRRRAHVKAVQLDPGVRSVIPRVSWKSDHQFGTIALFLQEPIEDEGADQAPRPIRANVQAAVNRATEKCRRKVPSVQGRRTELPHQIG